jgi:acyl CoA:acetate/3-ketoacid CoA transferase beta subunit
VNGPALRISIKDDRASAAIDLVAPPHVAADRYKRVDMLITNYAVFRRPNRQSPFQLIELAHGVDIDLVRNTTEAYFEEALV